MDFTIKHFCCLWDSIKARDVSVNAVRLADRWLDKHRLQKGRCLVTGGQSVDLGMLWKSASSVAWVDFELHRNQVNFVFRWRKDFTVWSARRLVCLVKNASSSIL